MSFFSSKLSAFSEIAALLCVAVMPMTACSQSMNTQTKPEYRENPNPEQAYRLTMRIDGGPGTFDWIRGFAQYDVENRECLPPPKENPGGYQSPVPTRSIPFDLERLPDDEYAGTVFVDGMIDEDYHGRGICRWALKNVQVQLKATGVKNETLFMADLYGGELLAGHAKKIHYSKRSYPRHPDSTLDEPLSSGQTNRSRMASYLTDDDLFTITLSAQEAAP
ncbi:hypothetical protein FQY83_17245 [Luteimonas marina]|uniref:N-acetyltransferase n=1 Tax=Luteimonas marina TaxID=488485 RepID=A0A5C5TSS8_9GAMM|nr:hypothetical protein [Luteimonas marina]TWT17293.1 hypothetical protein FQY83_17245 [Luteimonas marina]